VPADNGYAVQFTGGQDLLMYSRGFIGDATIEARFAFNTGAAHLALRHSAAGMYSAVLDGSGQIALYRGAVLLGTASIDAFPNQWRTMGLSAIGDTITVTIESVPVISVIDSDPLPPGTIDIFGDPLNSYQFWMDDVSIYGLQGTIAPLPLSDINADSAAFAMDAPPVGDIVYVSNESGSANLWTRNSDGSSPSHLTNSPAADQYPTWSSDGQQIAFVSNRSGSSQIWVMSVDGSNLNQLTPDTDTTAKYFLDWYGNEIAYSVSNDICILNLEDDTLNRCLDVAADFESDPRFQSAGINGKISWSPDGSKIAALLYVFYEFTHPTPIQQVLVTLDSSTGQQSSSLQIIDGVTSSKSSAVWSPDGTSIAVSKPFLSLYPAGGGGNAQQLTTGSHTQASWSPASGQIVFTNSGLESDLELSIVNADCSPKPCTVTSNITNNTAADYHPDWRPATSSARDVAPEAVLFHSYANEIGLPMPFDILPVSEDSLSWMEGYGPNTFSWKKRDFSTYRQTHGYHTGLDYGGLDAYGNEISIPVRALCDGVILAGRVLSGNGGSTKVNTGRGFVLRCFMDDPALIDLDGDGHRNLSNIAIAYNHLRSAENIPFPIGGQLVAKGEYLAQTTYYYSCSGSDNCEIANYGIDCLQNGVECQQAGIAPEPNHLHLEIFIARGFRDGLREQIGGDGGDSIRINPNLMFTSAVVAVHLTELGPYYPIRVGYTGTDSIEILESSPADFNDNDDIDFGIYEGDLNSFTPLGDITRPEGERGIFWTRQNNSVSPPISGVQILDIIFPEWPQYTFPTDNDLINHLFADPTYSLQQLYIGSAPYCSNVFLETGQNFPEELCGGDGTVSNDDADLDIGIIGMP